MVVTLIKHDLWVPDKIARYNPRTELGKLIKDSLKYLPLELAADLIDRISSMVVLQSSLSAKVRRWDDFYGKWLIEDYGEVGHKVVTDVGVAFIVDAWQNIVELEIMKFHGIGTGSTGEAAGDTALVTELTTQYNPDNVRATGTLAEGVTGNIFSTVATNTVDATVALREHGLFTLAVPATGVLFDRSVFASITLNSGDSIQTTYQATFTSGG